MIQYQPPLASFFLGGIGRGCWSWKRHFVSTHTLKWLKSGLQEPWHHKGKLCSGLQIYETLPQHCLISVTTAVSLPGSPSFMGEKLLLSSPSIIPSTLRSAAIDFWMMLFLPRSPRTSPSPTPVSVFQSSWTAPSDNAYPPLLPLQALCFLALCRHGPSLFPVPPPGPSLWSSSKFLSSSLLFFIFTLSTSTHSHTFSHHLFDGWNFNSNLDWGSTWKMGFPREDAQAGH